MKKKILAEIQFLKEILADEPIRDKEKIESLELLVEKQEELIEILKVCNI
jgi:hypothetical protein